MNGDNAVLPTNTISIAINKSTTVTGINQYFFFVQRN